MGEIIDLGHLLTRLACEIDWSFLDGRFSAGCRSGGPMVRVAKCAVLMAGRYTHVRHFKGHNRELRFVHTRLGRLIRDNRRKIDGGGDLKETSATP